jgi:secretion/DNA translocation related TadE-like protein
MNHVGSACRGATSLETGSATVIVVGVLGALMAALVTVTTAASVHVMAGRASSAADGAAIAAAAAAVGLVDGPPCGSATRVAQASAMTLAECRVEGVTATVRITGAAGVFAVSATARAGPEVASAIYRYDPVTDGRSDMCIVCLSASRTTEPRSRRTPRAPEAGSIIDQGVTCQARRSS